MHFERDGVRSRRPASVQHRAHQPPTHSHVPDHLPSFACWDSAVNVVFFGLLSRGKHVICHETVYGPSRSVLEAHYTRFGVDVSFVDTSNVLDVEAAIKDNTALVYLESPANPTVTVSDIPAICKVAKDKGVLVCVDNTFLGPCLQTPLDFGADIVINSLTKGINGHADVVAGCLVTKTKELACHLRPIMITLGACLDPNSAFLTRRGLKTMALRIERAQDSAARLAAYLEQHPKVEWIRYPGLESHPQVVPRSHAGAPLSCRSSCPPPRPRR